MKDNFPKSPPSPYMKTLTRNQSKILKTENDENKYVEQKRTKKLTNQINIQKII